MFNIGSLTMTEKTTPWPGMELNTAMVISADDSVMTCRETDEDVLMFHFIHVLQLNINQHFVCFFYAAHPFAVLHQALDVRHGLDATEQAAF